MNETSESEPFPDEVRGNLLVFAEIIILDGKKFFPVYEIDDLLLLSLDVPVHNEQWTISSASKQVLKDLR